MSTEAYKKRKRDWAKTESQKKKRREYMRLWREKNRDKHNKTAKESHHRNKYKHVGEARRYHLLSKYNMTEEQYNEILLSQNSKCLICEMKHEDASKGLHIDHDHTTGEIRGLLCSRCNGALGWYEKYSNEIKSYLKE
jgi:hypothetical protein